MKSLPRLALLALTIVVLVTGCGNDPTHPTIPPSHDVLVDWEQPFPPTAITEIRGFARDNYYAVGGGGLILQYNGSDWSTVDSPTREHLNGMWPLANGNLVAVGTHGTILRFDGHSWRSETSGTTSDLNSVWGSTVDSTYAVGYSGTVLRYDGHAWTSVSSPPSAYLMCNWGTAGNNMYVGATDSLYHFDGATWTNTKIIVRDNMFGIWGSSPHDVWASDGTNWPWHYDGMKWANVFPQVDYPFTSFWGLGPDNLYGVGDTGFVSHFDGHTWSQQSLGDFLFLTQWGSADNDWWVGGLPRTSSAGTLFHFDGSEWKQYGEALAGHLRDVWSDRAGTRAFAVDLLGTILEKKNGKWSDSSSGTTAQLTAVWGAPTGEAIAVGNEGTCLKFDRQSWQPVNLGTNAYLDDVWGSSMSDIYVGSYSGLWHFDGMTWEMLSHDPAYSIWGTSSSNVYVAGTDSLYGNGMVRHFDGANWKSIYSEPGISAGMLTGYSSGTVFANFYDNDAKRSALEKFDGHTWDDITPPDFTQFSAIAAGDNFGLVAVAYHMLGGGADVDQTVLRYHNGQWMRLDTLYSSSFDGAWGTDGGVYLVGGASIVRCHY